MVRAAFLGPARKNDRGYDYHCPWRKWNCSKENFMVRCRSLIALLLGVSGLHAADWPQWLGPTRDGVSPGKIEPWKEAPKVLWRQPVGEGHSSPVVSGGKVFVHAKVKDKDEEEVTAFDAKTGDSLWKKN